MGRVAGLAHPSVQVSSVSPALRTGGDAGRARPGNDVNRA